MEGTLLLVLSLSVLLFILSKLRSLLVAKPKLNLPPGPWTLPLIGSLHHPVTEPNIHRAMRRLSNKHGPLMTLRLGEVQAMVVTSPEPAQEIMKTHDVAFADRLMNATFRALFFDGNDVAFAPYGERWRQLRKICVLELLSPARVPSFRRIREEEVAHLIGNLAGSFAAVDMTKMISRFINDTFVRESVGSRCKYQDEYLEALHMALRLTSGMAIADLFPSSRVMQALGTAQRKVLACRNRIQHILEKVIQETTEAMDRSGDEVAAEIASQSFVGVLLRIQKERSTAIPLDDDTIIAMMFDMFSAGSETSATKLNWCMTELVRNPEIMAKAQAKVREAFKGKSKIAEANIEGLNYLRLVIKEALRLHTPAPLMVPRVCREACKIMGYDVPKGMAVFVTCRRFAGTPSIGTIRRSSSQSGSRTTT